jgi:hypothetical protein
MSRADLYGNRREMVEILMTCFVDSLYNGTGDWRENAQNDPLTIPYIWAKNRN